MRISMDSKLYHHHNFDKSSLVTEEGGFDYYTCKDCGIKAKRHGINDFLTLIRPNNKKLSKCNGSKEAFDISAYESKPTPKVISTNKKVRIIEDTHLSHFDAKNGDIYIVVEAPTEEDAQLSGVWVDDKKDASFRLLPGEYDKQ